jgi:hypothetical protein
MMPTASTPGWRISSDARRRNNSFASLRIPLRPLG